MVILKVLVMCAVQSIVQTDEHIFFIVRMCFSVVDHDN
jgi:hypothetical protein